MYPRSSIDYDMDEFERLAFDDAWKKARALKMLSHPDRDASDIKIILAETNDQIVQDRLLDILTAWELANSEDVIEFFYGAASPQTRLRLMEYMQELPEHLDILVQLLREYSTDNVLIGAIHQIPLNQKYEIFEWVCKKISSFTDDDDHEQSCGLVTVLRCIVSDITVTEPQLQTLRTMYAPYSQLPEGCDDVLDTIDSVMRKWHEIEWKQIAERLFAMKI